MDLQQEQIARTLGEGHRVIHGAAGSGKTMILVFRAQFLAATARPERPILVMCFNKALAGRLEAQLRERGVDERVQVRTFHAWCLDLLRSYQIDVAAPGVRRGTEPWFAAVADTVAQAVDRGRVPGGQYHALLIDEAHDFEDAWLRIAARMVAPETNSLLVLYDDAQSIYRTRRGRRRLNFASLGIEARGRTSILRLNYRNTAEVLSLAVACARHLLAGAEGSDDEVPLVAPASAGRRGPLPVLGRAANPRDEADWLASAAEVALQEGLLPEQMAVLAPTKGQLLPMAHALRRRGLAVQGQHEEGFRQFDWRARRIKLMTFHAAKGLEFPWVAIGGLQALPLRSDSEDDALRLLYVAMTRSTGRLWLSTCASTSLVERVAVALDEVAQRFAGAG
jgi:superfamily I DNA/RNA helicase